MKVLAMMVFVVVMMVGCGGEEEVLTSGEIFCNALMKCDETNPDPSLTLESCIIEYDSNLCDGESEDSCFREFSSEEKDCLIELDYCEFWLEYESCLEQS